MQLTGDDHDPLMVMAGDLVMETTSEQGLGQGLGLDVDQTSREGSSSDAAGDNSGGDSGAITDDITAIVDGDDGGIVGGLHECIPSSSSSSSSSFPPGVRILTVKDVDSLTLEQRRTLFRGDLLPSISTQSP